MSIQIATVSAKSPKKQPLTVDEVFEQSRVTDIGIDIQRGVKVYVIRVEFVGEVNLVDYKTVLADDIDEFMFQTYKEQYYSERCSGRFDVDITENDMFEEILETHIFSKSDAFCYLLEQVQKKRKLKNEQSK